jgi:hypothetical protein
MGFMIPAVMKKKLRPSFGILRFMVVLIAVVVPAFFASHGAFLLLLTSQYYK